MTVLLYFAVVIIWGTTWIAIYVQQHAGATPVTTAVFWRFLIASLTLLIVLKLCRRLRRLPATTHGLCLIQGVCIFGANFLCFYTAAQWINSGLESVIFSMAVLYNTLNSWIFFRTPARGTFYPCIAVGIGRHGHPILATAKTEPLFSHSAVWYRIIRTRHLWIFAG